MVKVTVKWNKQSFSNVELDQNGNPNKFKKTISSLTGVPVDRQKLMGKGIWRMTLRDDEDLSKLTIKEGSVVTLIGTADVVKEPAEKTVFVEDMLPEQASKAGGTLPAGLRNLGNTCYMNSTLQCLRHIPELRLALNQYNPAVRGLQADQEALFLTHALRDTLNLLDGSSQPVPPMQFLMVLRQQYPQFAQQARGHFMQQDAQEFLTSLHETLARLDETVVKMHFADQSLTDPCELSSLEGAHNLVDALMGFETEETLTCQETDAEPPLKTKVDHNRLLQCYIQGGAGSDMKINYLSQGIKLSLEGQIEKQSEVLGRNAVWNKQTKLSRLPRYLCVHFMRFFWKATPDSQDHAGVKCKSLRTVAFPEILDVHEFCNDTLKARLNFHRNKDVDELLGRKSEDAKPEADEKGGEKEGQTQAESAAEAMDVNEEDQAAFQAALAMSMGSADAPVPQACGPGLPINFRGHYELFGVVTHKGRSADGGHYMGWVRQEGNKWLVFDDEDVSECSTAEVLQLSGGGDWHMQYLNFYRFVDPKVKTEKSKGEQK